MWAPDLSWCPRPKGSRRLPNGTERRPAGADLQVSLRMRIQNVLRTWRLKVQENGPGRACTVLFAIALVGSWAMLGAPSAASAAMPFVARGSAEQAYATGVADHARVVLVSAQGRAVQFSRADAQGGVLFRNVAPAKGYRIVAGRHRSAPLEVYTNRPAPVSTRTYAQTIHGGYQYLTTRDGTKLAIDVHLPRATNASALLGGGGLPKNASIVTVTKPYPTVIEYAGYGYANPSGPVNGIAALANLLGFAVVDVSMRGTGCSGGAYDYFEPNQGLDGYDVVQTIAHQPWVLDHKVGMLGISYGGISQLFTAANNPPALEAIAPLSPIDSTITTLYPGGLPEHRIRLLLGEGACRRRSSVLNHRGSVLRPGAHPGRRWGVPGKPGDAR